jgi:hypothetical protein
MLRALFSQHECCVTEHGAPRPNFDGYLAIHMKAEAVKNPEEASDERFCFQWQMLRAVAVGFAVLWQ